MDVISSKWRKPGKKRTWRGANLALARAAERRAAKKISSESDQSSDSESNQSDERAKAPQINASIRKLSAFAGLTIDKPLDEDEEYIIIKKKTVKETFQKVVCCNCKNSSVQVRFDNRQGFCYQIKVSCRSCSALLYNGFNSTRVTQTESQRPPFVINRVLTEAFLSIGVGHAGMESFCSVLGMPALDGRAFMSHLNAFSADLQKFKVEVLEAAREHVREENKEDEGSSQDEIKNIAVTFDGTWQKRGFTSLYGLGFVIEINTGLVVDFHVLSKYCHACVLAEKSYGTDTQEFTDWLKDHQESSTCNRNYEGSSPAMEMAVAEILWKRSEQEVKLRYTTLLTDGDSKTYGNLKSLKPYGKDFPIQKNECINHVSKRLYKGAKKVVADAKIKKVTLGGAGEGKLTDAVMQKLASYYRKAIERNAGNVEEMSKEIWAALYHASSTDKKHDHSYCPTGSNSWCFFNRAKADGEKPKSHETMSLKLNATVVKHLKPLYTRLTDKELLERCQGGTQNANECLHSLVWRKVPKERFVSKKRIEMGAIQAVAEFNMGRAAALALRCKTLNQETTQASLNLSHQKDKRRKRRSEEAISNFQRKKRRKDRDAKEKKKLRAEGKTYGGGDF